MQEGRWQEAASVLEVLAATHPGSGEVQQARELLALHLSAEESWSRGHSSRLAVLRDPTVRRLLIADLLLYFFLGAFLLWTSYSQSAR
jgi:hypothetical protein